MATSSAFSWVSEQLVEKTSLSDLEARGTVRLALKAAGLDPSTVSATQMAAVLDRILPSELTSRHVGDAESLCALLRDGVARIADVGGAGPDTPEQVFGRLGG